MPRRKAIANRASRVSTVGLVSLVSTVSLVSPVSTVSLVSTLRIAACRMAMRATAVLPEPVGAIASRSSLSSTMTSRHDTWLG